MNAPRHRTAAFAAGIFDPETTPSGVLRLGTAGQILRATVSEPYKARLRDIDREATMKHLLLVLSVGILFTAGCATSDSHIARRRAEVRAAQSGPLVERWDAIKSDPHSRGARMKLAFEVLAQAEAGSPGLDTDEIKKIISEDVRALASGAPAGDDPALYATAERWADKVMRDAEVAREVVCQGSALQEKAYQLHLRCAARAHAAGSVNEATRAWRAAYFAATEPAQQCEPIQRLAAASLHPERDMTGFSGAAVSRCTSSGVAVVTPAPNRESKEVPSDAEQPSTGGLEESTTGRESRSPPIPSGVAPAPGANPVSMLMSTPVKGGFELRADVVQPSSAVGTLQLAAPVQFGYGMPNAFIGVAPVIGITSSEAQGASVNVSALGVVPSGRYYFAQRVPFTFNGYLRAEVMLASLTASAAAGGRSASDGTFLIGLLGGGGAEYLFTPHFGVTADLSLRALFVNNDSAVSTGGNVGIVLHYQ